MAEFASPGVLALYQVYGYWQWKNDGDTFRYWTDLNLTVNTNGFGTNGLSIDEKNFAATALQMWEDVSGINFTINNSDPNPDIIFRAPSSPRNASSVTPSVNHEIQGPVTISISQNFFPNPNYLGDHDSYKYQTYVHEIGHALGLGHQGPYNDNANYATDAIYANDTWQYSVMSYFTQINYDSGSTRYVMTPQMADILAAITQYGAANDTRTGNTTYGFNSNAITTGRDIFDFAGYLTAPAFTIYDSGGTDTLDTTFYSQTQTISLISGTFSSVGGLRNNIGIYLTTKIENAIGGTGIDTIIGNELANSLYGGLEFDRLTGNAGNDRLDGGPGGDRMIGGPGNDTYFVESNLDVVVETASGGNDFVYSTINYTLPANVETLQLLGLNAINGRTSADGGTIIGNNAANVLTGSPLADTLKGNQGNDTLNGGRGADDLDGGGGADTVTYAASSAGVNVKLALTTAQSGGDAAGDTLSLIENAVGSNRNDVLRGTATANLLTGLAGNDVLDGGAGIDTLTGGNGRDVMTGGTARDFFDFNTIGETKVGALRDVIQSFERGIDDIDLRDIDAKTGVPGNNGFKFIGAANFHGVKGELRINDLGAQVIVQGDVNGNGTADFEILVKAGTLAKTDFLL
jgi:serralysin